MVATESIAGGQRSGEVYDEPHLTSTRSCPEIALSMDRDPLEDGDEVSYDLPLIGNYAVNTVLN